MPELDVEAARSWVDRHNEDAPPHVRDQVRIELDLTQRSVTIVECRPRWVGTDGEERERVEVARLGFLGTWRLYWPDGDGIFHLYDQLAPAQSIRPLLDEVDEDPTCIFWG